MAYIVSIKKSYWDQIIQQTDVSLSMWPTWGEGGVNPGNPIVSPESPQK